VHARVLEEWGGKRNVSTLALRLDPVVRLELEGRKLSLGAQRGERGS
jgi:hypothetical protein